MRNLAGSFTMRKDGVLPRGDWYKIITNKKNEKTKVYIYDEIGFWGTNASDFVNELKEVKGDFDLHLNSPGGEIFDGLAIYNTIRAHDGHVHVFVDGLAASAASFIAQAGDTVTMARNAQMMIHDGIAVAYGNASDLRDTANLLDDLSDNIADIYAQAAKRRGDATSKSEYRGFMREETWYNGTEAVEAGLADDITDPDEDEENPIVTDKWDLTFYNHAGREKAESPSRVAARLMVSNKNKEQEMPKATPKNTEEAAPPPNGGAPKEGTEELDPLEGDGTEDEGTEEEETSSTETEPSNTGTVVPTNKVDGVMINGKMVTDWPTIQAHMKSLQDAQDQAQEAFRNEFVESLSESNKIPATQVDSLQALVQSMNDEQFAAFQASYESAPASGLFESYGGNSAGDGSNTAPEASADEISTLEGTVQMLKRVMTQDRLEKTDAFKRLQALKNKS